MLIARGTDAWSDLSGRPNTVERSAAMHSIFFRLGLPLIDLYENLMFETDIFHHQPLPPGPKLLVSNHPSTTDPFYLGLLSRQ